MPVTQIVKIAGGTAISVNGITIDPTGATNGQVLTLSGGKFVPVTPGGGGGGTLASVYAAGANQASSTITYDSTRGFLKLLDAASSLGTLFQIRNNADSLSHVSFTTNSQNFIRSSAADGAAAVGLACDTTAAWANATSKPFRVLTGGSERFAVTGPGNLSLIANAAISGASAATNTIGMAITPNVADGASSVALDVNNQTALANASASLFRLRENGTTRLSCCPASTDGTFIKDGGGTSSLSLSTNAGTVLAYGTAAFSAGSGSATIADGTGQISMSGGNLTMTILQGTPDADGTRDWGLVGTRWRVLAGKRIMTGQTNMAHSATPAFDPTACNHISIGAVTANITGPTMVSGSAGEECTITFHKDATANAYTITTSWGSNVRMSSAALAFTTGSGSLVTLRFWWNANLSTPAWCEISRANFN